MRLPQRCLACVSPRVISSALLGAAILTLPSLGRAATGQLSCSPPLIRFGQVTVGQSVTQPVVLTNSAATSATISGISVNDAEFRVSGVKLPAVLTPGESITIQVSFAPSTDGFTGAYLTFASNLPGRRLLLPINGVGAKHQVVSAAPSMLSFGNVLVGASASLSVVVGCTSCSEVITSLQEEGGAFIATAPPLPVTINPKRSVTLRVTFKPSAVGLTAGSVLVHGLGLNIPFTGTGTTSNTGNLTISPSSLSFGNIDIGSTSAQTSTLTATGGSVTVSSASSNNSEFSISGTSFPLTIPAGQSTEIKVVFSPTKTGAASGSLTLSSNASNSTGGEAVSGTGVSPVYSVALSWNASTSSVAGYNVYRGTTAGAYSRINSSLDATTSYTDNTVVSGTTYYYAATAVSSTGQESGYSSPLKVAIP
jgi:Abnormal spindle-like microcephaly-assoc'd, ASPM-SPD-2-Hydin